MGLWFSIGFTLMFSAVFIASYKTWNRFFHHSIREKDPRIVAHFSSYSMALLHGLMIITMSIALLKDDNLEDFNRPNTDEENIALSLSLGYFIAVRHVRVVIMNSDHCSLLFLSSLFDWQWLPTTTNAHSSLFSLSHTHSHTHTHTGHIRLLGAIHPRRNRLLRPPHWHRSLHHRLPPISTRWHRHLNRPLPRRMHQPILPCLQFP